MLNKITDHRAIRPDWLWESDCKTDLEPGAWVGLTWSAKVTQIGQHHASAYGTLHIRRVDPTHLFVEREQRGDVAVQWIDPDESILSQRVFSKTSSMPIRDWKAALNRFTMQFEDRVEQG